MKAKQSSALAAGRDEGAGLTGMEVTGNDVRRGGGGETTHRCIKVPSRPT